MFRFMQENMPLHDDDFGPLDENFKLSEAMITAITQGDNFSGRQLNYSELNEIQKDLESGVYNCSNLGVVFSLILDGYFLGRKKRIEHMSCQTKQLENIIQAAIKEGDNPEIVAQYIDILRYKYAETLNGKEILMSCSNLLLRSINSYLRKQNYSELLNDNPNSRDLKARFNKLLDIYVILKDIIILCKVQLKHTEANKE